MWGQRSQLGGQRSALGSNVTISGWGVKGHLWGGSKVTNKGHSCIYGDINLTPFGVKGQRLGFKSGQRSLGSADIMLGSKVNTGCPKVTFRGQRSWVGVKGHFGGSQGMDGGQRSWIGVKGHTMGSKVTMMGGQRSSIWGEPRPDGGQRSHLGSKVKAGGQKAPLKGQGSPGGQRSPL